MSWKRDHAWEHEMHKTLGAEMIAAWPGGPPTCWRKGMLAAMMSRDDVSSDRSGDLRWHISLQHQDRVPGWQELSMAGHELRPGVVFCVGVPPKSWWINVHENVLHLWELRDEALVGQWRFEGRGDQPT